MDECNPNNSVKPKILNSLKITLPAAAFLLERAGRRERHAPHRPYGYSGELNKVQRIISPQD